MAARLVPWSIAGLSIIVLGILVVVNPHLESTTATITHRESGEDASGSPPWIIGVGLIGIGAAATLIAMLREERAT